MRLHLAATIPFLMFVAGFLLSGPAYACGRTDNFACDPGTPPPRTNCPLHQHCPEIVIFGGSDAIGTVNGRPIWAASDTSLGKVIDDLQKWAKEKDFGPSRLTIHPRDLDPSILAACKPQNCRPKPVGVLATGDPDFPKIEIFSVDEQSMKSILEKTTKDKMQ